MLISGHVKDNVIILDESIILPDGIKVSIMLPDEVVIKKSSGLCGIWKDSRPAEAIAEELISSRSKGREYEL